MDRWRFHVTPTTRSPLLSKRRRLMSSAPNVVLAGAISYAVTFISSVRGVTGITRLPAPLARMASISLSMMLPPAPDTCCCLSLDHSGGKGGLDIFGVNAGVPGVTGRMSCSNCPVVMDLDNAGICSGGRDLPLICPRAPEPKPDSATLPSSCRTNDDDDDDVDADVHERIPLL